MKYLQPILAGLMLHATIVAQTQVDLRTQSKSVNFTQATSTLPVKTGTVLPGTCAAGELFLDLDAPGGQNLYACPATNTWILQGSAGSLISVQSSGTLIGSRPVFNLVAGFGLVNMLADDGSRLNVQQNVDTAVVETRQGEQIGATLLCQSNSGSGTVYSCAMNPQLQQYTAGMVLHWNPDVAAIGGGTTLNVDGLGARAVKLASGEDPTEADVTAGNLYNLWYDGTGFRIIDSIVGAAASGSAQPACSSGLQGRFWFVAGRAGVKDGVTVCTKDATDTYAWRTVY